MDDKSDRLNDEISGRTSEKNEKFSDIADSNSQRFRKGYGKRGYQKDEEHEMRDIRSSSLSDESVQNYQGNSKPGSNGHQKEFGERSRLYELKDNEQLSNDHDSREMNATDHSEPEFCDVANIQNENAHPENLEMGCMNSGLNHSETTLYYPSPNAQYIDRGSGNPQSSMQNQPGSAAWNTQVPFLVVQYPKVKQPEGQNDEEESKPRNVWWYTTSRVFSALLIISSLVSDWLQYSDMNDPVSDLKDSVSGYLTKEVCTEEPKENVPKQFLYFTIVGTILAALQLANIIYQIVQNHRLSPDTEIRDFLDERTEVFFVNAFVKFPQTFLIHRYEENICLKCGAEVSPQKVKGILNGLSSLASSVWRYLTHVKVSSEGSCSCSSMFEKCAARFGECMKGCLLGCIKCICPCCCCCIDCKTFLPCCCTYVICKNSKMSTERACQGGIKMCDPKAPSFFAELASYPTSLVAFLYALRIVKYVCKIDINFIIKFVFDTVIGNIWDKVF